MKKAPGPDFRAPELREDVRVEANRCPFCRDQVEAEESVVCQDCLTRHHRPCWEEGSGCSSCRGINLLEPARERDPLPSPLGWKDPDGSFNFAAAFKGKYLRATWNFHSTEIALYAGDTLVARATRSIWAVYWQAMRTWFGKIPTWATEGRVLIEGSERRVQAVHHVTFTRRYVQIYVDGELVGPEVPYYY